MQAVVWRGPKRLAVEQVDDPKIEVSTDAVVRITATGICGSDLHLYDHGATMGMKPGDILGHESVGIVEEVGSEVHHISPGDRVVVPFNISCGSCYMCMRHLYAQCETTQSMKGRKGAALFGYTHLYGGVPGGQAQYLRVPQAHFGPLKVPEEIPDRVAVLLADVLPTAWEAVQRAAVPAGGTVVVYGLGPIGLMSCRIAAQQGADRVIAVDKVPDRLSEASAHGADVLDYSQTDDVVAAVKSLTDGRGADSVIDAVGMDADGTFADRWLQRLKIQPDRMLVLHQALGSVRRGGTVSVIGVYAGWMPSFPIGDLFDKQVALRWGQANVRAWTTTLLELLTDRDSISAGTLVTHEVDLAEAPRWYAAFRDRQPGVRKVVLKP